MTQTPPEATPPLESPSILVSTKAALGIPEDHKAFDAMITMHINSVLSTLDQLGVGPEGGIYVVSESQAWDELIGTDRRLLAVKSYMFLRVKMLFDPPDIGFVLTAMKEQIKELESRLNMIVDDYIEPTPLVETIDRFGDRTVYVIANNALDDAVFDGGDA